MFTCNQKCIYITSLHKLPGKLFKQEKNPQKEYLHGFNDLALSTQSLLSCQSHISLLHWKEM